MTTNSRAHDQDDFDLWFARANNLCRLACGLGLNDLADGPSYDSFRDGVSPREYVQERLEDEGFPFE